METQNESSLHPLEKLTTQKTTRRSVISNGVKVGLGATAIGPLLAACGGSSTGSSNGPVTIQFAAGIDQTGEQVSEINKFNQLHAGKIKVDFLQLPMVTNDQYSKILNSLRSQSNTPDVIQMDVTWPTQFVVANWLAPIDNYINATYLKQFWPGATAIGNINGKQYGIQRYMDIGMLYYRTDLVKKYGGGMVPQTRDDLQSLAQKIVAGEAANGIKYGYLLPGKKIEAIVDEWLELLWGAGGTIGDPGNFQLTGQTQVDALQYMHDLIYTSKLAPSGTNTYTPNDILNLFNNGLAPFMRNWTFAYPLANNPKKSKVAGKVGVAPTLTVGSNAGHGCIGGWILGINAFSNHKDEAWTFIDYMLSKDTQTSLAVNGGYISSRPDVASDANVQAKQPIYTQLSTVLNGGYSRPKMKSYNQFSTPLQASINGVLSGQQSAQDALSSVQSQVATLK
jgi:multiple sugar transport system substrate-binding protein